MPLLKRLRYDARGTTIIEFAVLAPVMILMIAGSIELGHLALLRSTLESAIGEASRAAMADMATADDERDEAMRTLVTQRMSAYKPYPGRTLSIQTQVFRSFGSAYPESFDDLNNPGQWDKADGEWLDDRNKNCVRDVAQQIDGKLGGVGDVVSYTATFPAKLYFDMLGDLFGMSEGVSITATTVMRNEPVSRTAKAADLVSVAATCT